MNKLILGAIIGLLGLSLGCSGGNKDNSSPSDGGPKDISLKKDKKTTAKKDGAKTQTPDQEVANEPDIGPREECNAEKCDDKLDCTEDKCNENDECDNLVMEGFCLIGGKCYNKDAANPANTCQKCDPTKADDWSAGAAGGKCDDKNACTKDDVCQEDGNCTGTDYKAECDALTNDCVEGVCDGKGKCNIKAKTGTEKQCVTADGKCVALNQDFPDLTCIKCTEKSAPNGELKADYCFINNKCVAKGTKNPANACQGCNPGTNTKAWSLMNFTCCKDDTTRQYCAGDGTTKTGNCAGASLFCRFNTSAKEYGCLDEAAPKEDSTGTYKRACQ